MEKTYKFSTLIAIILLAVSHTLAADMELTHGYPPRKMAVDLKPSSSLNVTPARTAGPELKTMRKADGKNSDIAGNWTFTFGDYYTNVALGMDIEAEYVASVDDDGKVTFDDPSGTFFKMIAYYDEESGELYFTRDYLQMYRGYYIYQFPFVYDSGQPGDKAYNFKTITARFDPTYGILEFEPLNGIYFGGATDAAGQNIVGYFRIYELICAEKTTAWNSLGQGQFLENIVYNLFTGGERNRAFVGVEVEESADNPGIFRVLNAFSSLYSKVGMGVKSPDMRIDARNPDNVVIGLQPTGLNAIIDGETGGAIYYLNDAAFYEEFGWSLNHNGVKRCTMRPDGEGNLTIVIPYHSCFIYASSTTDYFFGSEYESVLEFKAGDTDVSIIVDDAPDLPAEYFTLQGIRVENPSHGQILIMRRGKKISKIVF